MNELLSNSKGEPEVDPFGLVLDAENGLLLSLDQPQRLPGYDQSVFLVWFEGHAEALVIAPTLLGGTTSRSALDLEQLLSLALC